MNVVIARDHVLLNIPELGEMEINVVRLCVNYDCGEIAKVNGS